MAINRVNTPEEEQQFKFLSNQSSILRTVDTNNITVNGENVIVDKPKRGDIMCLANDKNKIVWIDGLSINLKQLPAAYEAIGICLSVKGNKAMVRYREERDMRWLAADYWELQSDISLGQEQTLRFTIDGQQNSNLLHLTQADTLSLDRFVSNLNEWFEVNARSYSAQLVLNQYQQQRLVVYGRFTKSEKSWKGDFGIYVVESKNNMHFVHFPYTSFKSPLKCIKGYYLNNNFFIQNTGGCCRALFYDYIDANQVAPTGRMNSINSAPNPNAPLPLSQMPAKKEDFDSHEYCSFLRDHFANYDEYLESWMVKFPCGAGGTITEFPCGKENTYILNGYTFLGRDTPGFPGELKTYPLYPAANWAASISFNHPKLSKGNWWLPSSAEMTEILRDITYNTSFWTDKPDIINRVLKKLTSIPNSGWSMLDPKKNRWTSSQYDNTNDSQLAYYYNGVSGILPCVPIYLEFSVAPITIYEF